MPYQPYQSTWTNPYVQQTSYPQYLPVQPSQTQAYSQPVNGIVKVNGRDSATLMRVLNEHMEAIRAVYPKEYDSVMSRIRALG